MITDELRAALDILHADANDPKRAEMWRYGVRHTLSVVENALEATTLAPQPDREALAQVLHDEFNAAMLAESWGSPWDERRAIERVYAILVSPEAPK